MIRGPVKRAAFIYTRPQSKCGIAAFTADSIVNSKPASEEGFDRIASILFSAILQRMVFLQKVKRIN